MKVPVCLHLAAFVMFYVDSPVTLLYTDDDASLEILGCPACGLVLTVAEFHDLLTATLMPA